ncbi:HAD family hydrolase [Pseudohongiella sp.]|uniref:Phosphoserine phosphatase n=1 Tax=marine sediment metagenome TaxID=412755 RepID=A0A0F9XJ09_9ZZZZ|nr:HAD family phosphatase [Pseudohongiella sp.]HDZ08807.1 HAD-IB family hydrolase [Pseudohongiella sp.]HEA62423.1 HAD-IB family hydrolase [Pseudohongiella sp.]
MTKLAIFDLDNTLLAGDSDHAWGEYLCHAELVDADAHRRRNDAFYQQYKQGVLDMNEYCEFAIAPVAGLPAARLAELHALFMRQFIEPMLQDSAQKLINEHKAAGDICLIVTATNRFITAPIAERLGITHLIATDLAQVAGVLTGKIDGKPCFQAGKIGKLESWLRKQEDPSLSMQNAVFYSDSFNDIPLLEAVGEAVAVDPDDKLRQHASDRGWRIISLRSG